MPHRAYFVSMGLMNEAEEGNVCSSLKPIGPNNDPNTRTYQDPPYNLEKGYMLHNSGYLGYVEGRWRVEEKLSVT